MPLIRRQPRPISRDQGFFRDARLFVVATEDTYAPKQYFALFSNPRLHVEVLETIPGQRQDPRAVVNRLIGYAEVYQIAGDDQLWALLDTDHWTEGKHKAGLLEAIADARQRGYRVAMSNPCFELWLLLHHESVTRGTRFADCDVVGSRIRSIVGSFNKTNLRPEHYPIGSVHSAVERARALETMNDFENAAANYWPETTGTRVFLLIQELVTAGFLGAKR